MADIELVIKIPESQYKTLHAKTQADVVDVIDDRLLIDAIKNGVPLSKGHGDLIDRKKLGITPIDSTDLPTKGCLMVYLAEDVDGATPIIEADKVESEE